MAFPLGTFPSHVLVCQPPKMNCFLVSCLFPGERPGPLKSPPLEVNTVVSGATLRKTPSSLGSASCPGDFVGLGSANPWPRLLPGYRLPAAPDST